MKRGTGRRLSRSLQGDRVWQRTGYTRGATGKRLIELMDAAASKLRAGDLQEAKKLLSKCVTAARILGGAR